VRQSSRCAGGCCKVTRALCAVACTGVVAVTFVLGSSLKTAEQFCAHSLSACELTTGALLRAGGELASGDIMVAARLPVVDDPCPQCDGISCLRWVDSVESFDVWQCMSCQYEFVTVVSALATTS